jgi:putative membrane protein
MKSMSRIFIVCVLLGFMTFYTTSSPAQAIDPTKSAKAAALSDSKLISKNIEDNEDVMFLSQKAMERATEPRIKELAQQMLTDHTAMLYAIEQLQTAGTGSSNLNAGKTDGVHEQTALVNEKLSKFSGAVFDSLWVSNLLDMQQAKYDELTQTKLTVTNPQLKMAVTEAIPLVKKSLSQLKSLQKSMIKMAIQKRKEEAKKEKK